MNELKNEKVYKFTKLSLPQGSVYEWYKEKGVRVSLLKPKLAQMTKGKHRLTKTYNCFKSHVKKITASLRQKKEKINIREL